MKTNTKSPSGGRSGSKEPSPEERAGASGHRKYAVIKLGIDVHAAQLVVARMIDSQNPQPAQSFCEGDFLAWVAKQQRLAREVYAVYEAGPFGYGLCRQLRAQGVKAEVIQPQIWDEQRRKRKTDKYDAREMVLRLDRFVAGNGRSLNLVRVPSVEEEIQRSQSRAREALKREHVRVEARGRSLLLNQGIRVAGKWWQKRQMDRLEGQLDPRLFKVLESYRRTQESIRQQLTETTRNLRRAYQQKNQVRPIGYGELSLEELDREICDWHRFKNRRAVGSYTGLCPGEYSTGESRRQGNVTKCGNRLVRAVLVELAWRVVRYQPDYKHSRWFREAVAKRGTGYRKRAIVAVARRLAVDLWRIRTGKVKMEELGLKLIARTPDMEVTVNE